MMPVLWLLGTLPILGYGIDPLSILVPFLIFSIGVSHAVQMTKTWEREVVSGTDSLTAAKRAFARLFIPGTLRAADQRARLRGDHADPDRHRARARHHRLARRRLDDRHQQDAAADPALAPAHLEGRRGQRTPSRRASVERVWRAASRIRGEGQGGGDRGHLGRRSWWWASSGANKLKVGDYGIGVPELRPESRYNRDNAKIIEKFAMGTNTWAWWPRRRASRARAPTTR